MGLERVGAAGARNHPNTLAGRSKVDAGVAPRCGSDELTRFHHLSVAGTPEARANVENFIAWSRGLGLYDPDIFQVDDLVKVWLIVCCQGILTLPMTTVQEPARRDLWVCRDMAAQRPAQ